MDIHDKIRFLREENGWSQQEFAEKVAVSRQTISNWETGVSIPVTGNIKMIAILCHVTTDYLVYPDCPYQLSSVGMNQKEYELLRNMIKALEQKQKEQ